MRLTKKEIKKITKIAENDCSIGKIDKQYQKCFVCVGCLLYSTVNNLCRLKTETGTSNTQQAAKEIIRTLI